MSVLLPAALVLWMITASGLSELARRASEIGREAVGVLADQAARVERRADLLDQVRRLEERERFLPFGGRHGRRGAARRAAPAPR